MESNACTAEVDSSNTLTSSTTTTVTTASTVEQLTGTQVESTASSAEATTTTTTATTASTPTMSKNQLKRLRKEQKRQETKAAWRKLQKDKRKLKDLTKRQEYEQKGREERQGDVRDSSLLTALTGLEYPVKKRVKNDPNKPKDGTVIFDVSFDGIMVNRETSSLCSQIMRCYAANRRAEKPFNLEVSGLTGGIAERFSSMYPEHERWDMSFYSEHFLTTHAADRENIIYLTPDTDTVLESIDPGKIYIIGGIVDKNRFKGKTSQTAQELGLKTARLPVPEFIDLKTSPVLTIFHVLEIMLKFKECHDWKESLEAFVPKRNFKGKLTDGESSKVEASNEATEPDEANEPDIAAGNSPNLEEH